MQERFRNNLNFKIILIIQCSSLHFAGSKIKAHSVLLGSGQAAAMGLVMLHCKSTYVTVHVSCDGRDMGRDAAGMLLFPFPGGYHFLSHYLGISACPFLHLLVPRV